MHKSIRGRTKSKGPRGKQLLATSTAAVAVLAMASFSAAAQAEVVNPQIVKPEVVIPQAVSPAPAPRPAPEPERAPSPAPTAALGNPAPTERSAAPPSTQIQPGGASTPSRPNHDDSDAQRDKVGSAGCLKITGRCQGRPRREEVRDTLDYVDHLLWFRKIYPWLWYVTILSGNIDTEPKQTWREVQQDMERAQKAKDRPEAEPEHELEPPQPVVPAPNRDGDVLGSAGSVDPSGSGQPAQPSVEGAAAGVGDAAAELVEGAARAKKLIDELLLKPN